MQPLRTVHGVAVPLDAVNLDTDQIIPARFLMKPRACDYGRLLFHDLRFGARADPAFPLNQTVYREAAIMVTAANFGCGSAREQAAYALADYGIRALIGPSFGDIFRTNCVKNGILVAQIDADAAASLRATLYTTAPAPLTIDLETQTVTTAAGEEIGFRVSEGDRAQLLSGQDDITRTLAHAAEIAAFEQQHFRAAPWSRPPARAVIEGAE